MKVFINHHNVVTIADDFSMPLSEWKSFIEQLIEDYGADMIMSADAGNNNVVMELHRPDGPSIEEFSRQVNALLDNKDISATSLSLIKESYGKRTAKQTAEWVKRIEKHLNDTEVGK
jgi:hypothetical protein